MKLHNKYPQAAKAWDKSVTPQPRTRVIQETAAHAELREKLGHIESRISTLGSMKVPQAKMIRSLPKTRGHVEEDSERLEREKRTISEKLRGTFRRTQPASKVYPSSKHDSELQEIEMKLQSLGKGSQRAPRVIRSLPRTEGHRPSVNTNLNQEKRRVSELLRSGSLSKRYQSSSNVKRIHKKVQKEIKRSHKKLDKIERKLNRLRK